MFHKSLILENTSIWGLSVLRDMGGSAIVMVLLVFLLLFRYTSRLFSCFFFSFGWVIFWSFACLLFSFFSPVFTFFFDFFPFFLLIVFKRNNRLLISGFIWFFAFSRFQYQVIMTNNSLLLSPRLGTSRIYIVNARISPILGSSFYLSSRDGALNWRGTLVRRGGRKGSFQHLRLSILAELHKIIVLCLLDQTTHIEANCQ